MPDILIERVNGRTPYSPESISLAEPCERTERNSVPMFEDVRRTFFKVCCYETWTTWSSFASEVLYLAEADGTFWAWSQSDVTLTSLRGRSRRRGGSNFTVRALLKLIITEDIYTHTY